MVIEGGNNSPINGLADYILNTQFENWRINRKPLDKKWEKNRRNFMNMSDTQWKEGEGEEWRSNSSIGFTKQKIITAFAQVIDFLLQDGKIPFRLIPGSFDEITIEAMDPFSSDFVKEQLSNQNKIIEQQLKDVKASNELIRNVLGGAIYGETYAKTPVEEVLRKGYRPTNIEGVEDTTNLPPESFEWEPYTEVHTTRAWRYISVWNIFRDMEGDDLQEIEGILHRELTNAYWLNQQIDEPYYIEEGIVDAIAAASSAYDKKSNNVPAEVSGLPPYLRDISYRTNNIQYIEYWGRVPRQMAEEYEEWLRQVQAAKAEDEDVDVNNLPVVSFDEPSDVRDGDEVEVMVAMADDYIIRYARTTKEQRPFYRAVWDEDIDERTSRGIADNVEDMQGVINGTFRAIEDNKKLSGNVILAIKERLVENMPKTISPGMKINLNDEAEDARQAIQPITIPDIGDSLISLLNVAVDFGNDDSLIPRIQQGFDEGGGKVTAFQISKQLAQAGKYLGQIILNYDDGLIEPIVTAFYDYNMMNPDISIGKGNFTVEAQGFQSFQARVQQLSVLTQFLNLVLSNEAMAGNVKVRSVLEDIVMALDLDSDRYLKSREQMMQEAQLQAQTPNPVAEAELKKIISEAEKNSAAAVKSLAEADAKQRDSKSGAAKTVSDIETNNRASQETTPVPDGTPVLQPGPGTGLASLPGKQPVT